MKSSTSSRSRSRTARLGLRASPAQETLIRLAAEASGRSITDFVLQSACEAAQNMLMDRRLFLLDDDEWQSFLQALDRPEQPVAALRRLVSTPSPWEA